MKDYIGPMFILSALGIAWVGVIVEDGNQELQPVETTKIISEPIPPVNIVFKCENKTYAYQVIPEKGVVTGGLVF